MATTKPKLITADELLQLHAKGVRGELIRGVLCETTATGFAHGKAVTRLVTRLGGFVEPRQLGSLIASDSGVRLGRDPDTVREPDIAYFSAEKIALDADIEGFVDVLPDLVVEVGSPSNGYPGLNDKAMMWLGYGVRLVWVVHPGTRSVDVHLEGHMVSTLFDGDTLDGLNVLPGFTCAVSDIFGPKPSS